MAFVGVGMARTNKLLCVPIDLKVLQASCAVGLRGAYSSETSAMRSPRPKARAKNEKYWGYAARGWRVLMPVLFGQSTLAGHYDLRMLRAERPVGAKAS